jgi:hypothetical protein
MPVTKPIATVARLRLARVAWAGIAGVRSCGSSMDAELARRAGTIPLDLIQIGGFCMIVVCKRNGKHLP